MVTFRDITSENYVAAVRLEVGPGQENYVASNCKSLVQACYETDWKNARPMGIYDGETMVGFDWCGLPGQGVWPGGDEGFAGGVA